MAIRKKKKSTILIIERVRTANCLLIAQLCGLPPKAAFSSSANQRQQMQILATEPRLSALPFFFLQTHPFQSVPLHFPCASPLNG